MNKGKYRKTKKTKPKMKDFWFELSLFLNRLFSHRKIYIILPHFKKDKKYCAGCIRNTQKECKYFKNAKVVIKEIFYKAEQGKYVTLNCFKPIKK